MPKKMLESAVAVDAMLDDETVALLKPPSELIVDEWGAFIGKHSERIRVSRKGEVLVERPLAELRQVLVTSGGVSLSSDVIEECARRGIPMHFLDYGGRAYASLFSSQLTGTVKTRREQLLAYTDGRGLALGRAFAAGKIRNQANLLRYMSKNRVEKDPELFARVRQTVIDLEALADTTLRLEGLNIDGVRGQLLALEGRAAHLYWAEFKRLLLVDPGWPGRVGQGATDLVNSLLNYGYGILYSRVEQAIVLAGLDPYAGFTHTDRPGKPSLVYDLVEEFRQPVVDRVVLALLNLRVELGQDGAGRLEGEARKLLAKKIMERLSESRERYEKKRQNLQYILFSQARHIATFVRGDLAQPYQPFICGW